MNSEHTEPGGSSAHILEAGREVAGVVRADRNLQ